MWLARVDCRRTGHPCDSRPRTGAQLSPRRCAVGALWSAPCPAIGQRRRDGRASHTPSIAAAEGATTQQHRPAGRISMVIAGRRGNAAYLRQRAENCRVPLIYTVAAVKSCLPPPSIIHLRAGLASRDMPLCMCARICRAVQFSPRDPSRRRTDLWPLARAVNAPCYIEMSSHGSPGIDGHQKRC